LIVVEDVGKFTNPLAFSAFLKSIETIKTRKDTPSSEVIRAMTASKELSAWSQSVISLVFHANDADDEDEVPGWGSPVLIFRV
jgi:hypothetical protein